MKVCRVYLDGTKVAKEQVNQDTDMSIEITTENGTVFDIREETPHRLVISVKNGIIGIVPRGAWNQIAISGVP